MDDFTFHWSEQTQQLYRLASASSIYQQFEPWLWQWQELAGQAPEDLQALDAILALEKLGGHKRQLPIAVIGPREATELEYQTAERLGYALAKAQLQLLCGGKNGVMEASAKGHLAGGGRPIGLIPETEWQQANPYISIPIASGIGKARNVLIAQACPVLIAVGGGYGTMSEMAFGLHFEKLILALGEAPQLPEVVYCADVDEVMHKLAEHLLTAML
ncbi:MAG: lysine decarboxylase [Pelistega sp.]|nr:lysine decarboxylase [Pelistega sp.]